MQRLVSFAVTVALMFTGVWFGYRVYPELNPVALPTACPVPKTEPERCMAFWFGTNDKSALRQRVCGKDSNAASRR